MVWNIVPVGSIPTNNYFQSFSANFIEEFLKSETKINERKKGKILKYAFKTYQACSIRDLLVVPVSQRTKSKTYKIK
jgi:hypothetical protein